MVGYRKILVAFDGSASAANALKQAIALSRQEHCWIKALAVVPSYEGDIELVGVPDIAEVLSGPTESLVNAARSIAREEDAELITDVEQGEPFEQIVAVAEDESCDLIIMGRRGHRRLERMLLGSVTARVIGHSHKDVLVVPRDAAIDFGHLLVAIDGSEYSRNALRKALELAETYGSTVAAVAVADIYPEFYADAPRVVEGLEKKALAALEDARSLAAEYGVALVAEMRRGDVVDEVISYARDTAASVIITGGRSRSGLRRFIMGSVTEKVIGLAPCPVLVARTPRTGSE